MFVSAYWHGVHAGYYLSFLTIPLCTFVEDLTFGGAHKHRRQNKLITTLFWFLKMRGFEYMSCGFLLLSYTATMRYWESISFSMHVVMLVLIPIVYTFNVLDRRSRSDKSNDKKED
jgi:lysophospholipid acyltransferase 7